MFERGLFNVCRGHGIIKKRLEEQLCGRLLYHYGKRFLITKEQLTEKNFGLEVSQITLIVAHLKYMGFEITISLIVYCTIHRCRINTLNNQAYIYKETKNFVFFCVIVYGHKIYLLTFLQVFVKMNLLKIQQVYWRRMCREVNQI